MDTKGKERGILKLEPRPRYSVDTKLELTPQGSCEHGPVSPQPSVDRLSVTWADPEPCSMASSGVNLFHLPSETPVSNEVKFSPSAGEGSEDEDYSASLSAVLRQRRASVRRSRKGRTRRPSSPFLAEENRSRRRSSVFTTSSGDTAISIEEGQSALATQEQIFENIHLHKEVLGSVKQQPLGMRRKLKIVHQAKGYIKRHEGQLQERLAQSKSTRDIYARFTILMATKWQQLKREAANTSNLLIPWELRIKEIESHFGSVVASYFTFLRWLFWVNLVIGFILLVFVIVPEYLTANPKQDGERKLIMEEERRNATNLLTLWEFEGILKFSPIFYGYYTNVERAEYRMPLAYFLTGLVVYIYSFVAILRKMAENSRMSKLSEKEDECIFSWKLFTGWDFMIGNTETAHNRIASVILGFKEALLEEAEKKKDLRNWRIISLRALVNVCVIILLAVSAYAVVTVVSRSEDNAKVRSWWRENETTIVVTMITTTFPVFFELLGFLEHYHPRKQLRLQLARIMLLNLLNLYSLIFALFSKIEGMSVELDLLKPPLTNATMVTAGTLNTTEALIPTACYEVNITCGGCNVMFDIPTLPIKDDMAYAKITTILPLLLNKYLKKDNLQQKQNEISSTEMNMYVSANNLKKIERNERDIETSSIDSILEGQKELERLRSILNTTNEVDLNDTSEIYDDEYTFDNFSSEATSTINFMSYSDKSTDTNENNVYKSMTTKTITDYDLSEEYDSIITEASTTSNTWFEDQSIFTEDSTATDQTTPNFDDVTFTEMPTKTDTETNIDDLTITDPTMSSTFTDITSFTDETTNFQDSTMITSSETINNAIFTDTVTRTGLDYTADNTYESLGTTILDTSYTVTDSLTSNPNLNKNIETHASTTKSYSITSYAAPSGSSKSTSLQPLKVTDMTAISTEFMSPCPNISFNCTVNCEGQNITHVFFVTNCKIVQQRCYVTKCEIRNVQSTLMKNHTNITTAVDIAFIEHKRKMYNLTLETKKKLLKLCWETMFGQELVKLTVMDLVFVLLGTLFMDFFRALFVKYMNRCWCWDLEKKFPEYGDFKIAENILHLINNQGMVWMGMFFSPGLVVLNVFKLMIMMYLRSWAVMTCNVPHEVVFRVSKSNNFYLALLLTMLFLCVLPVGYTIVWVKPSWHCGPFSEYEKIYHILTNNIYKILPKSLNFTLEYIASPAIVIPLLVLLILIIYYLTSLTNSLREANNDLKIQLRRERTEERRKMFQLADTRRRAGSSAMDNTPFARWKKALPSLPLSKSIDSEDRKTLSANETSEPLKMIKKKGSIFAKIVGLALDKKSDIDIDENHKSTCSNNVDDETDTDFHETLPKEVLKIKDITFFKNLEHKKKLKEVEFKTHDNNKISQKLEDNNLKINIEKGGGRTDKKALFQKQKQYSIKEEAQTPPTDIKEDVLKGHKKLDKQQTSESSTQSKQSDSMSSVIPVIMISTTESDEELLNKGKQAKENDTNSKEENENNKKRSNADLKSLRRQSSVDSINEQKTPKQKKSDDGHKYQYSL